MGVTFDFSYDLTEQYESFYGIEITVSLFYRVFGQQNLNILPEFQ